MNATDNTEDIIDLRNVIARVEEIEGELDAADDDAADEPDVIDLKEELATLEAFLEECKGNGGDYQWRGDWYPVTAIRDSYFEEAMDSMLEENGDIPSNIPPYLTITVDYDALMRDHIGVEFDGVTYYVR